MSLYLAASLVDTAHVELAHEAHVRALIGIVLSAVYPQRVEPALVRSLPGGNDEKQDVGDAGARLGSEGDNQPLLHLSVHSQSRVFSLKRNAERPDG